MGPYQRAGWAMGVLAYMLLVTTITVISPQVKWVEYLSWLVLMLGIEWEIIREDFKR